MSQLSIQLQTELSKKLEYPCEVYFCRKYPYGWMFKTNKTHPQRLGYNYRQAMRFILNSHIWEDLKGLLKEGNHMNWLTLNALKNVLGVASQADIAPSLLEEVAKIAKLVETAGGVLVSRQAVAIIVWQWQTANPTDSPVCENINAKTNTD